MSGFDYASEPKVEVRECNLCGERRFETIRNVDRYGLPVRVVRCLNCGLRFLNPRMSQDAYVQFYQSGTYRRLLEKLGKRSFAPEALEAAQRRYAYKLLDILNPEMEPDYQNLLDIGGSTGVVAEVVCEAFDLDGTVLEPSEAEAARAEARGLKVRRDILTPSVPDIGTFDVVLLCQTVEHLTDIRAALERIRNILSPGGLFFVDIAKGSAPKVDHCYYLDMGTMLAYLENAGFEDVKTHTELKSTHPVEVPRRISFVAKR